MVGIVKTITLEPILRLKVPQRYRECHFIIDAFLTLTCVWFRWIGSVNAFVVIAGGIFTGRLYDRGYL
jgi:hypothetical protein